VSTVLYLDTETYSDIPIKHGTHRYAEHVEVMLVAWAINEEAAAVWDCTADEPIPSRLEAALVEPEVQVVVHNSHFDRTVLRHGMAVTLPTTRIHDTMVQALAHGLPGSLDDLCTILRVPVDKAKDKAGKRLIQLFCKPQPATYKVRRATRLTHPEQWEAFKEYARLDIDAMREVRKRLPMVNFTPTERAMWVLDQKINDRGVAVDMELVHAAISAVDEEQKRLAVRTAEMTDGAVASTTQRDALLRYILEEYGIVLDDLRGATVTRMLEDEGLPADLRALLRVREQASTTSTSKYKALLRGTSSDGRLRGTLQYAGAMRTLRWAGRLFQPQNLPRPTLKQWQIDAGIEALKLGCAPLLFPDVMELLSSSIRGAIIAPKGRKMVVSDLSNIEGRVQAWLAGEDWKLQAFRDFDAGVGPDLYKLAYAKSFRVDPASVDKEQRQVGKVQELALGYAGGVGAFVTFAAAYGIDLEELPNKVLPHAPESVVAESDSFYTWVLKQKMPTFGLSPDAYIACDVLKRGWRYGHPAIASYWPELEDAAIRALLHRGERFRARKVAFVASKNWLFMELPSGRSICYPAARILNGAVTYMGINQYTRKWERIKTTGGKLFENLCQALARDVMAHNMPAIDAQGYEIVLSVHDELITETPDSDEFTADELSRMLAANPPWAPDMPLAAAGFETYTYRKE
jgi:DNA polymerase